MKKTIIVGFILLAQLYNIYGQNSQLNQQKYWDYRNRLKRDFVWIGNEAKKGGQSIPMENRGPNVTNGNYTREGNYFPVNTNWLVWGDNPCIHLGYYMSVLATEYKLLSQNGQSTTSTLNEIYYCLRAIERLDQWSDIYLRNNNQLPLKIDGVLLRSDVDTTTAQNWTADDSSFVVHSKGYQTYNQNYPYGTDHDGKFDDSLPYDTSIYYNPHNIISADEITGLQMGLFFIKKYVANKYVKPTANDSGVYIIDKTMEVWNNIMIPLKVGVRFDDDNNSNTDSAQINWIIRHPLDGYKIEKRNKDVLTDCLFDPTHRIPVGGLMWYTGRLNR